MIYYVCKYTPIELFRGFGEECSVLEEMPENFEQSDQIALAVAVCKVFLLACEQCWKERLNSWCW